MILTQTIRLGANQHGGESSVSAWRSIRPSWKSNRLPDRRAALTHTLFVGLLAQEAGWICVRPIPLARLALQTGRYARKQFGRMRKA
jgi:hypothetical protein